MHEEEEKQRFSSIKEPVPRKLNKTEDEEADQEDEREMIDTTIGRK
jgi:hypothetical protein